jgi:hypothetical protein
MDGDSIFWLDSYQSYESQCVCVCVCVCVCTWKWKRACASCLKLVWSCAETKSMFYYFYFAINISCILYLVSCIGCSPQIFISVRFRSTQRFIKGADWFDSVHVSFPLYMTTRGANFSIRHYTFSIFVQRLHATLRADLVTWELSYL